MNLVAAAVVLLALSSPVRSSEEEENEQYLYGEMEFMELVPSGPHFVMFFAPWCGHCKSMKGEWNKLAAHYNENEARLVTIIKVDCTENKELCLSSGVKGFPTMQLYLPGKEAISYTGDRKFEDLKNFVIENLPDNVDTDVPVVDETAEGAEEKLVTEGLYNLTGMTLYRETKNGDVFVLFIQDGCRICEKVKETWKDIAKIYEDNENVKIGQVDCITSKQTCEWESPTSFPIVRYYHGANVIESRSITPDIMGLKNYIDRKLSEPPAEIDEGRIIVMTNETIKDVISTGVTFAKLYHPQCGFCIRMRRAWNQLGHVDFSDAPAPVAIAELDCGVYETACRENGGGAFPTLLAYMDGEIVARYSGPRTVEDMKQFAYDLANGYRPKPPPPEELVATDGLYNMSGWDFFRATMRGNSFVLFIQEGCECCEKVKETWNEVAKFYENEENLKIGLVNCRHSSVVCESEAIRGFPTVKFYRDGNEIEGRSITQDTQGLIAYIDRKLKEPVAATGGVEGRIIKMTDETIKDVISTGVTFVKFFSQGCGFCMRMERAWEKLGEKDFSDASGPVTIAELNCDQYMEACRENGARGFPSLVLFIDGVFTARYDAARTPENMHKFVLDMANGYQHKDHQRDEL